MRQVNAATDPELLREYAIQRSEPAFAALVHRYVDLVHSAAFRMVGDAHLAQDVTQATFTALAQNARQLTGRPTLAGWLCTTARNLAVKMLRTDSRRRVREREAVAMNELLAGESEPSWKEIAPGLDAALDDLNESDRDALVLRYFERKTAAEMAAIFGITAEAAQKRVSRAVERLRTAFAQRGIAIGATSLGTVITANAVQAAPMGLAVTISAAALAGSAVTTSTFLAATTKTIAMTTLQKTLFATTVAVLAGAGIYKARLAAQLCQQVRMLQAQQAPQAEQIQQLQSGYTLATNQLAVLRAERERLNRSQEEMLRLRGEVGLLRSRIAELESAAGNAANRIPATASTTDPSTFPKESWGFVGNATPEAALRSGIWALSISDSNTLAKLMPEEETRHLLNAWNDISAAATNLFSTIEGLSILEQRRVSDDEVLLTYRMFGANTNRVEHTPARRQGDGWVILPTTAESSVGGN